MRTDALAFGLPVADRRVGIVLANSFETREICGTTTGVGRAGRPASQPVAQAAAVARAEQRVLPAERATAARGTICVAAAAGLYTAGGCRAATG